jgi:thioredoxin reductase (NADPH)
VALRDTLPDEQERQFDYDLVVIGGGSGGLAAAKEAAKLGARVALCDLVKPSETRGTIWGLGGTCVNVGCIPKKLMHSAAVHREQTKQLAEAFGWEQPPVDAAPAISWTALQDNVENYVRSLNFGYVVQLRENNIKYLNAHARFVDAHTLECTNRRGDVSTITARRVLLAMGGRPTLPEGVAGAREHGVTSDDVFRLKEDPGKTLVVGASYVALECAGFLHGIGREATVMMRSVPLRGFDVDMAQRVVSFMEKSGVRFVRKATPVSLSKSAAGIVVDYRDEGGAAHQETFDTVLFATGRRPETRGIGLETVGVQLQADGKVVVDAFDRTSVPHVYAVGDIVAGGLELTPVAIHAGRLLARRLYGGGEELISYQTVPTTVFTPLEYGCVGLTEELAAAAYPQDLEVFHTHFSPLSWSMAHVHDNECYMKLLVRKSDDRVLGFHLLAPDAGEIVQGVAVAMRCGARKRDFDNTIGIHPTVAEDITQLRITKSSGESAKKEGC